MTIQTQALKIDWYYARTLYLLRREIHRRICEQLQARQEQAVVRLVLGIDHEAGNYTAYTGKSGRVILKDRPDAARRVYQLVQDFAQLRDGEAVPGRVLHADIGAMSIPVGTEIALMVNPEHCWLTNRRSIWAYFLSEYNGDVAAAREAFEPFNKPEYRERADLPQLHVALKPKLLKLLTVARGQVKSWPDVGPRSGLKFLAADVIASGLYDRWYSDKP